MNSWTKFSVFNMYIGTFCPSFDVYTCFQNFDLYIFKYLKYWVPKFISSWFPLYPHWIQVNSIFWSYTGHFVNCGYFPQEITNHSFKDMSFIPVVKYWRTVGKNISCTIQGPLSFSSTHHALWPFPKPQSWHMISTTATTLRSAALLPGIASHLQWADLIGHLPLSSKDYRD